MKIGKEKTILIEEKARYRIGRDLGQRNIAVFRTIHAFSVVRRQYALLDQPTVAGLATFHFRIAAVRFRLRMSFCRIFTAGTRAGELFLTLSIAGIVSKELSIVTIDRIEYILTEHSKSPQNVFIMPRFLGLYCIFLSFYKILYFLMKESCS